MRDKQATAELRNRAAATALAAALAICLLFPARAYSAGAAFLVDIAARHARQSAHVARCTTQPVVASGLRAPVKLVFTQHGHLLVAEMGFGFNTGRLSVVDPSSGQRRTLLDGLPSGPVLPSDMSSGPAGLAVRGRTLYVAVGGGDSTLPGAAPGTRVPNPNPSSPLFSSVLAVDFTPHVERTTAGFALTGADHFALRDGAEVGLDNGGGDKTRVRLVADFPDYAAEPRPDEQRNVRPSAPFGLAVSGDQLYVADSDSNSLRVVDLRTGAATTLKTFAPLAAGESVIEAVPSGVRLFGDQLLMTFLNVCKECRSPSAGAAEVWAVSPGTSGDSPLFGALSAATDALPVRGRGRAGEFLTLELSANVQAGLPGRLRRYASPDAAPEVVADCLNAPTSLARDERTGELFVAEMSTGQIVKVAAPRGL